MDTLTLRPVVAPRRAAPPAPPAPSRTVLGVRVDAPTYEEATRHILAWARAGESRTVYATGAHGVVEAQDDAAFRAVLNAADLNVPDGMSLVKALRELGLPEAGRVYGPDLTLHVCRAAAEAGVPVAFYGSTEVTLGLLRERLTAQFPDLQVVCTISPPFRSLTDAEDAAYTARLRDSGAGIVFVGLGCPRQERWCHAHRGRLPAVLLAVGAAFDFHAGTLAQAPAWVQRAGLEWAFRLAMEPRRLWRRYTRIVPRFMVGFAQQRRQERQGSFRRSLVERH
ncbi:MAG TPA: WecB/TagA/CpsF family glycosyltransferase [Rubricoccaceae bacterium]|nr:WecB/TagA/CpsF family glycosyltransferase [Rubricoccaceae bacterium]